jgi:hypothetical protein
VAESETHTLNVLGHIFSWKAQYARTLERAQKHKRNRDLKKNMSFAIRGATMIASTSRVASSVSSSSGITKRSSSSFVNALGKTSDVYVVRKMRHRQLLLRATSEDGTEDGETSSSSSSTTTTATKASSSIVPDSFDRDLNKFVKKTATTFAPSSSGEAKKKKNPATKGTVLYTVFEVQAYLAILVGGLLAFNVIYPSEEPTIARLMGMWSVWMFTVPSLRARDCGAKEKDALNLLFIAIPLINVLIPFVWKSFAGVFTADVLLMLGVYYSKNAPPFGEEERTVAEPSE